MFLDSRCLETSHLDADAGFQLLSKRGNNHSQLGEAMVIADSSANDYCHQEGQCFFPAEEAMIIASCSGNDCQDGELYFSTITNN